MAVLSSTNTLAQVRAAWLDNASYAEDDSASKCQQFITASIMLLGMQPAVSFTGGGQGGGQRLEFNQEIGARLLDDARGWLAANRSAADRSVGVTYADMAEFRQ